MIRSGDGLLPAEQAGTAALLVQRVDVLAEYAGPDGRIAQDKAVRSFVTALQMPSGRPDNPYPGRAARLEET